MPLRCCTIIIVNTISQTSIFLNKKKVSISTCTKYQAEHPSEQKHPPHRTFRFLILQQDQSRIFRLVSSSIASPSYAHLLQRSHARIFNICARFSPYSTARVPRNCHASHADLPERLQQKEETSIFLARGLSITSRSEINENSTTVFRPATKQNRERTG